MISDELVAGMAITHVRARDVGAQLITNALRALVHIDASAVDFVESFIAVALERSRRVDTFGRAR